MCIVCSSHSVGRLRRAPFCETRKCVHQWRVRDLWFGSSNLESNRYFFGERGKLVKQDKSVVQEVRTEEEEK